MHRTYSLFALICLLCFANFSFATMLAEQAEVRQFIQEMVDEHDFDKKQLTKLFSDAELESSIIKAISRPAEAKPWYKYRPIFLTTDRIRSGVKFLQENEHTLRRAEKTYGVPVEIMVAIIGVETRYGKHAGGYRVIDSLSTLAFNYPKRSKFFRSELKQFLLMTREQKMDPLKVMGSYAGAMGIPQFISSSFRHYAVDFDDDGVIDIWNNPVDAIGSVGNYFKVHGWQAGAIVARPARVTSDKYMLLLSEGLEPTASTTELASHGIVAEQLPKSAMKVKLLEYELESGPEFWLGFENFYVITRYNHSALYAMAVYQLAEQISAEFKSAKGS